MSHASTAAQSFSSLSAFFAVFQLSTAKDVLAMYGADTCWHSLTCNVKESQLVYISGSISCASKVAKRHCTADHVADATGLSHCACCQHCDTVLEQRR